MPLAHFAASTSLLATLVVGFAFAQEDLGDPTIVGVNEPVDSVVLYQGRAQVTRTAEMAVDPDYYHVEFRGLPETIDTNSLQARVTGGKLLDVQFRSEPTASRVGSAEWLALEQQAKALEAKLRELAAARSGVEFGAKYLDRLLAESTQDFHKQEGRGGFDIEAATKQLEFVAIARGTITGQLQSNEEEVKRVNEELNATRQKMAAMGGGDRTERTAVVSLVVLEKGEVTVALQHLVHNATWRPAYAIRANRVPGSVSVEYDAVITQSTGEPWDKVAVTLSTAQPTTATNPPQVSPVYVDVYVPPPPPPASPAPMRGTAGRRDEGGEPAGEVMYLGVAVDAAAAPAESYDFERDKAVEVRRKALDRASHGAAVDNTGTAVTFTLPRAITVASDGAAEQRTRIDTIDGEPTFVHAAQPVVTEGVFLRGDAKNSSALVFLPGEARIFLDGDFIGPTRMVEVPPSAEFEVYFGLDPMVTAKRTVVSNATGTSGFFNDTTETKINYRIDLQNARQQPVTVEVWDRMPVSRNEQIKVSLKDPSAPLATDAEYTDVKKKQGILKWSVPVGAATAEGPTKSILTWMVEVARGAKVQTTPIPQ